MRTARPTTAALAGFLAVVLGAGLIACSDDGETIDADADEEVMADAILTIDDLPEGFEETEPDDDEDDDDSCDDAGDLDQDEVDAAKVAEADPVSFQLLTDDVAVGVDVDITSFSDVDVAEESLEAFESDAFLDCIVDSFEESAESEGQDFGEVSAEVFDPVVDGDAAAAIRIEFESQGFPTVVEQHLVLTDRFGIGLQVFSLNDEVDADLVEELLETMIDRIQEAIDD